MALGKLIDFHPKSASHENDVKNNFLFTKVFLCLHAYHPTAQNTQYLSIDFQYRHLNRARDEYDAHRISYDTLNIHSDTMHSKVI